jgi:puromycin-sensitive aminopeptidase
MGKTVTRLYQQFQPSKYNLHLTIDEGAMTFTGIVTMWGKKVGRPSQRLTLHQKDLTINEARIVLLDKAGEKAKELGVSRVNTHQSQEEVRIHTDETIYPGTYWVSLEFSGKITRPMNGLYPCFFTHDGKEKKLFATQFESHHAREVFPCIDEPEAKATFDLALTLPDTPGRVTIANTPAHKPMIEDGKATTIFDTTPVMSTYLLAFVTGEMSHLEAKTKRGTIVRTYATPDKVELTQFALDCAVRTLEFYEDYFAIPYPLEKCDMIALPDFASGAMENWGCITYREHALLVDEDNTTLSTKQWVAMVVAHELAHQWFGNLVTMRWWTDLWLNEGFASWIEYLAVDHMFPEWNMWTQFIVDEQQQALKLDALEHTHPIEVPVNHPDEIRSIFDAISYSKGASAIHMLNNYLGPEVFRDGLRHYLNRHKYGNTDTVDLWQALEEISGKPVTDFMQAWTSQSGFPVVHADIQETKVQLRQERFFINPGHKKLDAEYWPVPLLASEVDAPEQFSGETIVFELPDSHTIKLNKGQSGFYRTTYNTTHLKYLGELIRRGRLDPIDRLGVLSDTFETAKAGESSTVDALQFLGNFRAETDYTTWDVIASALGGIRSVMDSDELRELMKPYSRSLIKDELGRLGWDRKDNDSHFDLLLRPIILGMAAAADEQWVLEKIDALFRSAHDAEDIAPDLRSPINNKQLKRGIDIDPDLRGVVFGNVARRGGKKEFDRLVTMHNESTLSDERLTLSAAITGFKQPELIEKALNMINSDAVRLQDVGYWIAYSFLNRHAKAQTWEWVKANWEWLHANLGSDLSFYRMPVYAARAFSDRKFIKEYEAFFKPKLSPALDRSYNQGLEMLQWQSAWKDRDFDQILAFFKSHK